MSKRRKSLVTIAVFIILLIATRAILPTVIQDVINDRLSQSEYYDSRIGDVDLSLIRGSYKIDNVEIIKSNGDVPVPLFSAHSIEFSLLWRALLNGAIVGEIDFYQPVVNVVDSDSESKQQTGEQVSWLGILDGILPLRIDRATI